MKNFIFKALAFLSIIIIVLTSCSGSDDNNNSTSQNVFFCKVDGVNYSPPHVTGFISTITNTLVLTGSTGTNAEQIQIFLPNDIAVGTYTQFYDFTADEFIQMYYSPPNSQDADDDGFASSGQLVITEHDISGKRIKGTFNFVTDPSVNGSNIWNVSEGSFEIRYEEL